MPKRESYASGTPNWVDLQAADQDAAKAFFAELLGWSYNDLPADETGDVVYAMAMVDGLEVAAIAALGDQADAGMPAHWNAYVSVDDIDATLIRVAPAGGTVLAPAFDVLDAGRMAVIQDPTGAILELWQPARHVGAALVDEPGAWSWTELITPDIPAAAAFYNAVFGWDTKQHDDEPPYTEFTLSGASVAGALNPPMPGIPPSWGVYFSVSDTDAIVTKAEALGASVRVEPTDIPPGRFAVLADPQGALFNVITMRDPK